MKIWDKGKSLSRLNFRISKTCCCLKQCFKYNAWILYGDLIESEEGKSKKRKEPRKSCTCPGKDACSEKTW